jgi:hypothetical protein
LLDGRILGPQMRRCQDLFPGIHKCYRSSVCAPPTIQRFVFGAGVRVLGSLFGGGVATALLVVAPFFLPPPSLESRSSPENPLMCITPRVSVKQKGGFPHIIMELAVSHFAMKGEYSAMLNRLMRIIASLVLVLALSIPSFASHRHHRRHYYRNSSGNLVHSPVHARTAPAGASARCNDGTYSFSQHHQGTCSHHGGVSEWLK